MSAELAKLEGYDFITIDKKFYQINPTGKDPIKDLIPPNYSVNTFSVEDGKCDFAHATIFPEKTTPIQLVNREGIVDYPIHGSYTILIWRNEQLLEYSFDENKSETHKVRGIYHQEDIICCIATSGNAGEFLEQCTPPYEEGDFTNLPINNFLIPNDFIKRMYELMETN